MNRLQKIILSVFSPEKRAQIQAESQRWLVICPRCGWRISVWEAGRRLLPRKRYLGVAAAAANGSGSRLKACHHPITTHPREENHDRQQFERMQAMRQPKSGRGQVLPEMRFAVGHFMRELRGGSGC